MKEMEFSKKMYKRFYKDYDKQREFEKLEIESDVKNQLLNMNAKITLPKVDKKKRNRLNVYTASAELLTGVDRICYLKIDEEQIEVCEYKGARGDRFSGYYRILLGMLKKRGISDNGNANIILSINQLGCIIECVNIVSHAAICNKYRLVETDLKYPRTYGGVKYELPISYYEENEESTEDLGKSGLVEGIDFYRLKKDIIAISKTCATCTGDQFFSIHGELMDLKKYVDNMFSTCDNRKAMIEETREINL